MKTIKLLKTYYWIIFLTTLIYLVRTCFVDWLADKTIIIQYGALNERAFRCYPLPPIFIDVFIFSIIGTAFLWTRKLKKQTEKNNSLGLANDNNFEIVLLSVLFIAPFAFIDIKLLQLIIETIKEYLSARPVTK
ncbi:hypothetical protein ACFOW1_06000 [Parasediminibacterium paludis]|uniref:Uncharacterized protein n=2 Tax=Parasediminibacterium paludis TaxID=908966 RepID=A0ABV8PTV8_9BACT